jgi:DNA-binding response OmpR family regulator
MNRRCLKELLPVPLLLDGLRILLLEDEPLIAMDVEQLCRDNGADEIICVRDLKDVEREVRAARFDAAIVDLMLSGASTLDFARDLHERGVPFVFASGYSEPEELASSFPGVALVEKPYAGADLVEAIAAAWKRSRPQAADEPIT